MFNTFPRKMLRAGRSDAAPAATMRGRRCSSRPWAIRAAGAWSHLTSASHRSWRGATTTSLSQLSKSTAFLAGPQLHALEGLVRVEVVQIEADVSSGRFFADCLWHDSCEDEVHIAAYGIGSEPACWMQTGYASGFTSVFMGRPILYREMECRSTGYDVCRIIGKPVSEWGEEARDDLRHLQPQSFVNQDRLSVSRATAAAPAAPVV